eukprot:CAMPEP_0181025814 /NCGR_PEP_ID=MMETSP1070-20121207/3300_1 /TAXON_ID=265543 /ORGANISM="Minutocellus polymorphus, Strain NH13" /LENGTH=796 /DNA_ID=CAMNT_0023102951 /DNA_START=132 /DNA_END=2522 /DNA_ORIENTATION=-
MPYPTSNPTAKHDLVGPTLGDETTLSTTEDIIKRIIGEDEETASPPHRISTVYTYSDAPTQRSDAPTQPKPLSRKLTIVGYADVGLSLVRKFTDDGPLSSHMTQCSIGVKRADRSDLRSMLDERNLTNSDALAKLAVRMRDGQVAAIVESDPYGRFGILRPMDGENGAAGASGTFTKLDYALDLYVGNLDEIKNLLTGGGATSTYVAAAEETTAPFASEVDTGGEGDAAHLWQPPGMDSGAADISGGFGDGGGSSSELWQPPGADDNGADAFGSASSSWAPVADSAMTTTETLAGQKRPRSESPTVDENGGARTGQFHADEGAATADKFYSGLVRTLDTRADSRLYHMRAFNGWVKATQIAELDPRTGVGKKASKTQPLRILDLACGKGGDLGKWTLHPRGIRNYVGVDVARGSLKDAAIRARKMRKNLRNRCTFTCADLGSDVPGRAKGGRVQKLLSWSLASEPADEVLEPKFDLVIGGGITPAEKFDVVSIQFAIHYMMSTRKRAMRFFKTVSDLLDIGGNLIVTTIDARVVMYHLMDLGLDLHFDESGGGTKEGGTVKVGAGACRIKFNNETLRNVFTENKDNQYEGKEYMNDKLYGLQYTFTLVEGEDHASGVGEAVDLPEWMSPLPALTSLAEAAGFELEYATNFHEFYAERKKGSQHPNAHNALYNMKVLNRNGSISEDEWEISGMYMALKFRKVRESQIVLDEEDEEEEVVEEEEKKVEAVVADPETNQEASTERNDVADDITSHPDAKKKFPMAMMKAKKMAGDEVWNSLSSEEKKERTNAELRKMLA